MDVDGSGGVNGGGERTPATAGEELTFRRWRWTVRRKSGSWKWK